MPDLYGSQSTSQKTLHTLGSFVLVIACLYWGQKILIPLTLAILLAFILSPAVIRLQRLGLGRILAVILVVAVSFSILGCICWGVAAQLRNLMDEIPRHRQEIGEKIQNLGGSGPSPIANFVDMVNDIIKKAQAETPARVDGKEPQPVVIVNEKSPAFDWVTSALGTALDFLFSTFFMAILVVFMLAKSEDMRDRFFRAVGRGQMALMTRAMDLAAQRISTYLMTQFLINVALGLVWAVFLLVVPNGEGGYGISFALLWGAILAALRFVPYVGTWVALALPLLLSIALSPVSHPWLQPLLMIGVFTTLELVTANAVEPLLFGHHTGVSPVALLVAAVFWAWLWGPIGLVMSTPLTVCLVVLGKYVPQVELLNICLGPEQPPLSQANFYQRLLVRDEDEATEVVQAHLKREPVERVFDDVLLAALSMASQDAERGTLEPRSEQFIHDVTRRITDEIVSPEFHARMAASGKGEPPSPADSPALVLGCPARGEFDELALYMLDQLLQVEGFRLELVPAAALTSEVVTKVGEDGPAVACISALPPGGLAQASYLCKRLRRRYPDLKIFVGRWGQTENVERMKERLTESGATKVVTSLLEMRQEVVPLLRIQPEAKEALATAG